MQATTSSVDYSSLTDDLKRNAEVHQQLLQVSSFLVPSILCFFIFLQSFLFFFKDVTDLNETMKDLASLIEVL